MSIRNLMDDTNSNFQIYVNKETLQATTNQLVIKGNNTGNTTTLNFPVPFTQNTVITFPDPGTSTATVAYTGGSGNTFDHINLTDATNQINIIGAHNTILNFPINSSTTTYSIPQNNLNSITSLANPYLGISGISNPSFDSGIMPITWNVYSGSPPTIDSQKTYFTRIGDIYDLDIKITCSNCTTGFIGFSATVPYFGSSNELLGGVGSICDSISPSPLSLYLARYETSRNANTISLLFTLSATPTGTGIEFKAQFKYNQAL